MPAKKTARKTARRPAAKKTAAKKTVRKAAKKTVAKKTAKKTAKRTKAAKPAEVAAPTTVQEELIAAAGIKKLKKESDGEFRQRLIETIDEKGDEIFSGLSNEAQAWFNDSVNGMNDGELEEPLPFPGDEAEEAEEAEEIEADEDEPEEIEADEAPKKRGKKVAKKTAAKRTKPVGSKKSGRGGARSSKIDDLRTVHLKNWGWKREDMEQYVADNGIDVAPITIQTTFWQDRSVIRALLKIENKTVLRALGFKSV